MMWAMALAMLAQGSTYPIGGRVVHALTGAPVAGVRMTVSVSGTGKAVARAVTGGDGRFRMEGFAAGKYSLEAERNGYVMQHYGQRVLYAPYVSAVVAGEGQETGELTFRLIPSAAITGVVTDERNEPLPGMDVTAYLRRGRGEHQKVWAVSRAKTNDLGQYRLHSLTRGSYLVVVSGRPWQGQQATLDASGAAGGYAATFHPGATDVGRAGWVQVEAGAEARADVRMTAGKAVRVEGTLKGGQPAGRVWAYLLAPLGAGATMAVGESVYLYGGRFRMREVPPGRYQLLVVQGGRGVVAGKMVEVEADPTVVELDEEPGAKVKVSAVVRGRKPGSEVMVALGQNEARFGARRVLDEKGTADFGVMPGGRYELMLGGDVALVSMASGSARVVGESVEIPESGEVELKLEVDAGAGDLLGRVYREGKAMAGVKVVLIPKRQDATLAAYRFDQSDSDGSFRWRGVAAGEYLMFGFEEGEAWDYMDEGVMRGLKEQGQTVEVKAGKREEVRLEVRGRVTNQ